MRPKTIIPVCAAALFLCSCGDNTVDVLIVGGAVVDGTGSAIRNANISIDGDVIVSVGRDDVVARDTVDATGFVVAPGFIDVHSHTPPALLDPDNRLNEVVVRQGVTTVVGGPDGGFGPNHIAMLIEAVNAAGAGTNVAFYVGHNAIRDSILGSETRQKPTDAQMEAMRAMVRYGMEQGALGLSTGLMYEPGMFSETTEVIELAKVVEPFGGIYDSHVRNPVHALLESDLEAIEIGRQAGIPVKLGHLKAVGLHNEGKIAEVIAAVQDARDNGVVVVSDQYPYDGAATSRLRDIVVLPSDLQTRGEPPDLNRLLSDLPTRMRIKQTSEQGIDDGFAWLKATGYSSMRITSSADFPDLVGRYLSELAGERQIDPFDLVSDLLLNAHDPVGITLGAIKETDVRTLMVQPWNMIASDGAYSDGQTPIGHPRSTGTFPRVLGRYVREWRVLSLEVAVHKMTGLPSASVGLTDRGRLAAGYAADVVIFDPITIVDRSTWDEPHLFAEGVRDVIVNGVFVLRDGAMTGVTPGRILRRTAN